MKRPWVVRSLIWVTLLILVGWFFSFRILESPLGLTADEGAFGINATLLSRTLHDENGRFLPFFVLSLDGTDWRQPVTQYFMALYFKIFGSSVFNLRFTSVVVVLVSMVLIYQLARHLVGSKWGWISVALFLLTPIIMIHAHMGLDNIMPIPFTIIWLLAVVLYKKTGKNIYLTLAGLSLGIGFYSYKGMRATVPVWVTVTGLYVLKDIKKIGINKIFKSIFWFALGIGPLIAIIPLLQIKYPGAVFDDQKFVWDSWYTFLYPYFSSFDISYLFVSGDATPWHSTGKHGMMLLASAPLFFTGVYQAVKKRCLWGFILLVFLTAPLLYGMVSSVHRASRLLSMIPAYSMLCTLGFMWLWQFKKWLIVVVVFLGVLNYSDFVFFYWYKYPELTRQWFGDLSYYQDYEVLANQAAQLNLTPYLDSQVIGEGGVSGRFFEIAYLGEEAFFWTETDGVPENSILLSQRDEVPGFTRLDYIGVKYKLHSSRVE